MSDIVNKVEKSGLITIDLEDFYPTEPRKVFDLKEFLYQELVLKEKDFRQNLKDFNWEIYKNSYVAIHCSSEAIIPSWGYLLVVTYLTDIAKHISFGSLEELERDIYTKIIQEFDVNPYKDKKVIIKGCSGKPIPQNAYVQLVQKLKPMVFSLMYGEACSTVPIYKQKK